MTSYVQPRDSWTVVSDVRLDLLGYLRNQPGSTARQIGDALDMPGRRVAAWLHLMRAEGLVTVTYDETSEHIGHWSVA